MTALKAPCPHGYYDAHGFDSEFCPGGSLLPPDSLVIVKEDGGWPEWARAAIHSSCEVNSAWKVLDALAAAQRSKE